MSEPRIGRVLVASLHQAIAELLPDRLEFYENWLSVSGLREGTIGLAPLHAVLSFLRGEGDVYGAVVARAGECAADWTVSSLPALERRLLRTLPLRLRTRAALRNARALVRATYPGSRAIVRFARDTASVDLRGSLFCEVREVSVRPLCGYYAAAVSRVLEHFAVPADTRVDACRAAGGGQGCVMSVTARRPGAEPAVDVATRAS
jgi:bacteriochlorophyll 4-vinyl reductase